MKKLLLVLLLGSQTLYSQAQIIISGKVSAASGGNVLSGASVTLHPVGAGNILGYSISNAAGEYRARANTTADSIDVRVAFLGFAAQTRRVSAHSQVINFSLADEAINIKEVKVRAPKIRMHGDTIVYDASQFKQERDRTLIDFLDRMPGVDVDKETGRIKYQGKNINKFYVENQDLMGARYGEVSKNLPADAVKSVDLYENHQPIKALQDISYSDQAAMNIRLKDNSKGRWIGNGITAGLGFSPLLWKAEFTAMRFAQKMQTYVTYKTNNIGQDITIYNFAGASMYMIIMGGANTSAFYSPFMSSPALDNRRSMFNRTHMFSINNLWNLGKESNIRFYIDYKNDERAQDSEQETIYYLQGDSTYTYAEKNRVRSHSDKVSCALTYTKNSRALFLENKTEATAEWQKINATAQGDGIIKQNFRLPNYEVSNNLRVVRRTASNRTYRFLSENKYSSRPHELDAAINSSAHLHDFVQEAKVQSFSSANSLSFGHSIKRINVSYRFGYDADIDRYDTGKEVYRRNNHKVGGSASLSYKNTRLNASLTLPLRYINISGSDDIDDFSGVVFNPSLYLRYSLGGYWEANANASINSNFGDIYTFVSGVMKNYRTQYVFNGVFPRSNSASVSGGLNYRNPVKAIFMNANLSYRRTNNKNISEQIVDEANIINRVIAGRTTSQSINANGGISKIFDWKRCTARLNWSVSQNRGEQRRGTEIVPIKNLNFSLNPKIDIETFAQQMLTYSVSFSAARSEIDGAKNPFMRNIKQNFSYYIPITKKLNVMIIGEHLRNQISKTQHVNMFLMDAVVRYRMLTRLEFTLTWNNIFDTDEYSYSSYNDLYYSSYSYKLRPSNVLLTVNFKFK